MSFWTWSESDHVMIIMIRKWSYHDHHEQRVITALISPFPRTYSTVSYLKSSRVSLMKNYDHHLYLIDHKCSCSIRVQTVQALSHQGDQVHSCLCSHWSWDKIKNSGASWSNLKSLNKRKNFLILWSTPLKSRAIKIFLAQWTTPQEYGRKKTSSAKWTTHY